MTYELAKQLKGAGFPQDYRGEGQALYPPLKIAEAHRVYAPSLSELIAALGKITVVIWGCVAHGYYATSQPCAQEFHEIQSALGESQGETPEEAVARLWLALHQE